MVFWVLAGACQRHGVGFLLLLLRSFPSSYSSSFLGLLGAFLLNATKRSQVRRHKLCQNSMGSLATRRHRGAALFSSAFFVYHRAASCMAFVSYRAPLFQVRVARAACAKTRGGAFQRLNQKALPSNEPCLFRVRGSCCITLAAWGGVSCVSRVVDPRSFALSLSAPSGGLLPPSRRLQ